MPTDSTSTSVASASSSVAGLLPDALATIGPDAWSAPYWDAAREHRLLFARCTGCSKFNFPAVPFCGVCLTQSIDWVESSGLATLYSFTIVRHGVTPDLLGSLPYVIAVVDINDSPGVRMLTNVVDCDLEALQIGDALKVYWHDTPDGVAIPRFTLA
jgi:uncharacterized protein